MYRDNKNRKVAAYARVSTDLTDQLHSLAAQIKYFTEYISTHDGWELIEVYSDEGITGTSTKKRDNFNRMIKDCEDGKIDTILTKEVSRFARNTVDTLNYTRRLSQIGVNVIFMNDGIDTNDKDGELRLTIMASIAQEESRKISERVKWGIRRKMEDGWVYGRSEMLGYRTKNGKLEIVPEEAETVKRIFHSYVYEGKGCRTIANDLNAAGLLTVNGKMWREDGVIRILKNDKYTGDLIMQKYYTVDHLSHRRVKNDGTLVPIYTIPDHHDAIISREQFDMVQTIMNMRLSGMYGRNQYPFGDKLICPYCNNPLKQRDFQHTVWARGRGWECVECHEFLLKSKGIEDAFMAAYTELDIDEITAQMGGMDPNQRKAAEQLAEFKRKNEITALHYYWIDRLIKCIEFGAFACKTDRVLMVNWKFGMISTKLIITRKTPKEYAAMIGMPRPKSNNPGIKNLVQSQRKHKIKKGKLQG